MKTDLEVLASAISGGRSARETTLFDSVGFAVEDLLAARYAYTVAADTGAPG